MSIAKRAAIGLIGFLLPLAGVRAQAEAYDFKLEAKQNIERHTKEEKSPFRKALREKLKVRMNDDGAEFIPPVDYPEPELTAGNGKGWGPGSCEDEKRCEVDGYVVKFKAVTKLTYDSPKQVFGKKGNPNAPWPELKIEKRVQDPVTGEWVTVKDDKGKPVYDDGSEGGKSWADRYKDAMTELAAAGDPPSDQNPEGSKPFVYWKDAEHPDGRYEFGQEPQVEDVIEEITFTFPPEKQDQGKKFFRSLAASLAAGSLTAEGAILLGFTYQGPNIDYTIGSTKRACLWGHCVTLWDIKAGFALDFGLGLRAPIRAALSGPTQIVAGEQVTFTSTVTTDGLDGNWDAPQFAPTLVAAYENSNNPDHPEQNGQGKEFVMYFDFFAGAKVKILGFDGVCPYCKYAEVNLNKNMSYQTPFGGNDSFPIPPIGVDVATFSYGIVALTVGLNVTPQITSQNISAATADGAVSLAHHSSGDVANYNFVACIPGEGPERTKTLTLTDFRYNFDTFRLVLGAYMNFSVAGYGAWSPSFDFMTVDLSRIFGTVGAYLPNHRNCDLAFNCPYLPASQGIEWSATIVDQSAPTTSLTPSGTRGNNGWWTSDVTGTLSAFDNPWKCGSGVAETHWSVDGSPASTQNPFTLTAERKQIVTYASTDRDHVAEPANRLDVWIDKTPPTIQGAPDRGPNGFLWYNANVTVTFTASDATSGLLSVTPPQVLSAELAGQSATGVAEDYAGLKKTLTVGGINIDKTAPLITIAEPTATGEYKNDVPLALSWTVVDPLSGIQTQGASLDGMTEIDGYPLITGNVAIASGNTIPLVSLSGGNHTLFVTSNDKADNRRDASVTFVIDVDIYGLIAAIKYTYDKGWLAANAYKAFTIQATQAARMLEKGNTNGARGILLALNQELHARQGKAVSEKAFALLYADLRYVLTTKYHLIGA